MGNINEFETRTQILLAIKNIEHANVKNVSQKGDMIIYSFVKNKKILIEVKAGGTSGKSINPVVKLSQIMRAGKQLIDNNYTFDNRIAYFSSANIKSLSKIKDIIETKDIYLDFKKSIKYKEIGNKSQNYDQKYEEIFLCLYTKDKKKSYLNIIEELKREIKKEFFNKFKVKLNNNFFNLMENLLLHDWESGIVLDKQNIEILNKQISCIDMRTIISFSQNFEKIWQLNNIKKIEEEILKLTNDDFNILGYRLLDSSNLNFLEIINNHYGDAWSKEKKVLLCYLSWKEKKYGN